MANPPTRPGDERRRVNRSYHDTPVFQCEMFEYGHQSRPKPMFYVRFYDMVVLDIDGQEPSAELEREASAVFSDELVWSVTKTSRGFHMYLVSHCWPYYSRAALATFYRWDRCDEWYKTFCVLTGYKVRVSAKTSGERLVYPELTWGDRGRALPEQLQKVQVLQLLRRHHETEPTEPFSFAPPVPPQPSFFLASFFAHVLVHNPRNEPKVAAALARIVDRHRALPDKSTAHKSAHRVLVGDPDPELHRAALILCMRRPQWLLVDAEKFYVAHDVFTCTVYACFASLLMVDIDTDHLDLGALDLPPGSAWRVHRTRKGYHLFAVHREYSYREPEAQKLMLRLHCDPGYAEYSRLRGWSVRLNRKKREKTDSALYADLGTIGSASAALPDLEALTEKILEWSLVPSEAVSTMP